VTLAKADAPKVGIVIAEAAGLTGAPRGQAPVICLGEYGDSTPQALQGAGLVDLVLIQPLRRRELVAALAQLAAGAPLTEALDGASPSEATALPSFRGRRATESSAFALGPTGDLYSRTKADAHEVACSSAGAPHLVLVAPTGPLRQIRMTGSATAPSSSATIASAA